MRDSDHQDANAFIVYLSQDAIVANPISPKIAVSCPLHGRSELAWVVQSGQSTLQEGTKTLLNSGV